jgi:hypothetical protein
MWKSLTLLTPSTPESSASWTPLVVWRSSTSASLVSVSKHLDIKESPVTDRAFFV